MSIADEIIDIVQSKKVKLKTKDSNELKCKRCNTYFDSMDKVIYGKNRYKAHSICPKCGYGVPVVKITPASGFMIVKATGQYIREIPKTSLPKKERRRIAKLERLKNERD